MRSFIGEITDEETFRLSVSSRLAPDPYAIYFLTVTLAHATHVFEQQARWQRRWGRIMLATLVLLAVLIVTEVGNIIIQLVARL